MTLQQRKREDYFRLKKLGTPPSDRDDRRKMALDFAKRIPPDYETAIMLFDPEEDQHDSSWLLIMGYILDKDHNNPYFDSEKSFIFHLQASKLGNAVASYNLYCKYSNGSEDKIDIEAATYWIKKSIEQGGVNYNYNLAILEEEHDPRSYDITEVDFRNGIRDKVWLATESNNLNAISYCVKKMGFKHKQFKAREQNISLLYMHDTDSDIINYYRFIIGRVPNVTEEVAKYSMMWQYSLRMYLGLGVPQDTTKARLLLALIPEKTNHTYINQTLNRNVARLKAIIKVELENDSLFENCRTDIHHLYTGRIDYQLVAEQAEKKSSSFTNAYSVYIDLLQCLNSLAFGEQWHDRYEVQKGLQAVQAKKIGSDYERIVKSTLFMGPRYNPISENGLPVLGVWEPPSANTEITERHMVDTGAYVPEAGVVKFKGVMGNPDGTLTFDLIKASDSPAFLVPEDFEVALVMAFGDPEGMLHPYLSLEDPSRHGFDDKYNVFKFKEWNPHWLGYTDLGRTLYYTDQLIGRICWTPREFDIGSPDVTFDPQSSEFALELVEDITLTGGRSGAGVYSRVMLKPEHITLQIDINKLGQLSISVTEVKMRVDGDYIIQGEGKDKDLHLSLNDDMYAQGRTVNKLTRRYNDIAAMMPVFVRAEELMGLMHSIRELRNQGFKLHPDIQARVTKRYQEYQALPPLPKHEQLCVSLPLIHKRI